ncbi:MAG: tRNA U-34 5-methylaminomethyl-2-thiouridine biosynthesis protein [Pseudomonadota bacterium]|nr:tRNA U-34 5-methylaminomethyl-2-thiouridine biosynthesis protein [Pseudomonadota bacterium]
MPVVGAYLVPGTPLPYLVQDNPPWSPIIEGYRKAALSLAQKKPDVLLVYSTQWIAVLDELWQTRRRVQGLHVDENWYEYGELPYDLRIDSRLAKACVKGCAALGVKAKEVDYDGFPIDTGTIVAANLLNPDGKIPMVIAANNLYHGPELTEKLARMAVKTANSQKKRVAVIGVGGLSGTVFRKEINIAKDRIASATDDKANKKLLGLMRRGDNSGLQKYLPAYAGAARADMGMKHLNWIMGALRWRFGGAKVLAYGPAYGSGAAVVEILL